LEAGIAGGNGYIGVSVPRLEDDALLCGRGTFVSDIAPYGVIDAVFVRSPLAHARLVGCDVSGARNLPGVLGVWTAAALPMAPMGLPPRTEAPEAMRRPPLCTNKVRYVGDPIAVVAAENRYYGEDAAAAVRLDLDPLPAVLDPGAAAREDSPRLFDAVSNIANVREMGVPVDDIVASAPVVVRAHYVNDRVVPLSLEPHAIVVAPGPDGLMVWCSHQAPHRLKRVLARNFELSLDEVRVVAPDVGGAFGSKSQTLPEYLVATRLALELGRPVRWIEDRNESFVAGTHGRGQHQDVTLVADRAGELLALKLEIDADIGAYPHTGEYTADMTMWVASGCYRIPHVYARSRGIVTNKTPTASYRGAGRPEAAYAIECTMDALSRELGVDPAELRRKNFVAPDGFPYRSPTGATYDSGHYDSRLTTALDAAEHERWRVEQQRRRSGEGSPLGIGISSYIERSGGSRGSTEHGSVEVTAEGKILARSGTASQGQGHRTSLAQIVATALQVPLERVEVRQGDTAEVPAGTGTFGSRSIQVGGGALYEAASRLHAQARSLAAEMLGTELASVSYSEGSFHCGGRNVALEDVAAERGGLAVSVDYEPPQAFPFGTHVAVVEIDPDTGRITVLRLVAVDDCGVVVNPMIVRGQGIGSAVQGLGQALHESVTYDADGLPGATSFFSYAIPTAVSVPHLVHADLETPNPNVPLGTKGAGEAGCIGVPPAIVNAVADALCVPPAELPPMPLLPEKVWARMQEMAERG
jgi:aerobic carbon-monoxide dehydrogenase large subunit